MPQRQPYLLDPYTPQSQLRQQYSPQIWSPMQGFAELAGNLGETYLRGRQAKKEEKEAEEKNMALIKAYTLAANPNFGMYPDFAGPSDKLDANQRASLASRNMGAVDPTLAAQNIGGLYDAARSAQPKPPEYGQPVAGVDERGDPVFKRFAPTEATGQTVPGMRPPPQTSQPKNVQTETFSDGIFVINPDGTRGRRLGDAPARERMPRVKTYYDEEGNPLTLDANESTDQEKIKSLGLVESAPTEAERTSKGYLDRMVAAEVNMQKQIDNKYDPANFADKNVQDIPVLGNYLVSDRGRQFRQAQEDWVRAKLRKESGAVIADEEMEREIKTYFPQPGDKPADIEQKKASRKLAERQLATSSGILGRKYLREASKAPQTNGWSIKPIEEP